MVAWTLISSLVNEGCTTYANGGNVITQLNFPYSILNYILVWRNIIVFFHNVLIVVVINLALSISVGAHVLLVIVGLLIVAVNGVWMSVLLGIVGARYRDIPPLVANVMQVMMFITPVFWNLSQLPAQTQGYLKLNYHSAPDRGDARTDARPGARARRATPLRSSARSSVGSLHSSSSRTFAGA